MTESFFGDLASISTNTVETDGYNPDLFVAMKDSMGFHELGPEVDYWRTACENLPKSEIYARGLITRTDLSGMNAIYQFHFQSNMNSRPIDFRSKANKLAEQEYFKAMNSLKIKSGDLYRFITREYGADLLASRFYAEAERAPKLGTHTRTVWRGNISPTNQDIVQIVNNGRHFKA